MKLFFHIFNSVFFSVWRGPRNLRPPSHLLLDRSRFHNHSILTLFRRQGKGLSIIDVTNIFVFIIIILILSTGSSVNDVTICFSIFSTPFPQVTLTNLMKTITGSSIKDVKHICLYYCKDRLKNSVFLSLSVCTKRSILFGQGNSTYAVYKWRQAKIWRPRS